MSHQMTTNVHDLGLRHVVKFDRPTEYTPAYFNEPSARLSNASTRAVSFLHNDDHQEEQTIGQGDEQGVCESMDSQGNITRFAESDMNPIFPSGSNPTF
jgi:hypothetical protein